MSHRHSTVCKKYPHKQPTVRENASRELYNFDTTKLHLNFKIFEDLDITKLGNTEVLFYFNLQILYIQVYFYSIALVALHIT